MMKLFCENRSKFLAVNCLYKKTLLQIFDSFLNTPLNMFVLGKPEVKMSGSHELVFGGNYSVTCSSISNPKSNLSWYQNGNPINKSSNSINIVSENKTFVLAKSELNFISVSLSDKGNYSCRSQNEIGTSEGYAMIKIICESFFCSFSVTFVFGIHFFKNKNQFNFSSNFSAKCSYFLKIFSLKIFLFCSYFL